MKSIRLSLLVYFFALLAAALGAVSVLAYQYSERMVAKREEIQTAVLQTRLNTDIEQIDLHFNNDLSRHAGALAGQWQAQWQSQWPQYRNIRARIVFATLGSFSAAGDAKAPLFMPVSLGSANSEIVINEESLHMLFPDSQGREEYFQINSEWGGVWRSKSMNNHFFPFDAARLRSMRFADKKFDPDRMESGANLRRITIKVPKLPPARFNFPGGGARGRASPDRRPQSDRRNLPDRPVPNEQERRDNNSQGILVQFAADASLRDAEVGDKRAQFEKELENLKEDSNQTLASLSKRLLWISMAAFAAVVAGSFWLVRVGLSPLQRLSEAVSQVSVKDFRLPFDDRQLPGELRPIVERLVQTLDLLKRTFAREKQAAADISHDLRTPLAALLTTIEVGLRKERSPEEYREMLTDCHAAGQQISYLVERLLALARLDAGVDTLRPRHVDVAKLAEQCANLVRPLAQARDLTLRVHRNGPLEITSDPDKLREIVTNLLHNAIEYNQPNGSVDLTVERHNGSLHLEVRDTGIGIAPEAREQIFERFYRVDTSRHSEGMHAGLGLAIVKGYVELMGGKIGVESTVGKGSVFSLHLPA